MQDNKLNMLTIYLDNQENDLRQKYLTVESNKRTYQSLFDRKQGGTAKNDSFLIKLTECGQVQKDLLVQIKHIEAIRKEVASDRFKWE